MGEEKNGKKTEQKGLRLWPGITLLAGCTILVFVIIHLTAYRTGVLQPPSFLQSLGWQQKAQETHDSVENYDWLTSGGIQNSSVAEQYFSVGSDPTAMLASLIAPETYYQRMRFNIPQENAYKSRIRELYVNENCWKIVSRTSDSSRVETILCDGASILREGTRGDVKYTITPVGDFSAQSELGIPTLGDLQALENPRLQYMEDTKNISVAWELKDNLECTCYVSLDTGLIMEMMLRQSGEIILYMYTELYDIAPDACEEVDFFKIQMKED